MWTELRYWISGLAQLRHPDVARFLGETRERRMQLQRLRELAPGLRIAEGVLVIGYDAGRFRPASGVQVREGTVLAFGDEEGGYGCIDIGKGSWIGQYNNLRASAGGNISIGSRCLVSQFCTLVGSQHAHAARAPISDQGADQSRRGIVVGDDVWLGAGVVVTPGVEIGDGVVVGANAVVTGSIPAHEIWAGVPARRIGIRK
jgi:acetyltransferase-like isoleucine patch superfamily enzyme